MATAKKTQIVITANAAVAKKVMNELQQRIDGIKQKMAALDVTTKQGQREFNKLKKELVSYNSAVSQNVTNTERISKAMKNLSGTSLNELKRALSAAKSELGKMSASDKGLKQMQNNVKALQGQIDKLSGSVNKQSGAWQTAMKNLSAYVGMFALFNKAKELVTGAIKKNFEYSGSLTDIRKVSGMTMEEVNKLSTELAKIDTRTSVDGLAQLAYQGAKLGMGKYGVDGMAQFVKAADKINVALGEELGEEALPALSKMVEVMGLIPKMGIEKAMDATGSAMFKLSTTSTATSNDIVEFSKRLTGVARTAGITTDQLLALGSASSSMMLMPEVASTALGKFIVALQKNHNLIAQELGIPDETIKNLYASGHAMDAIVLVLEKMRDKGNMNALGGIFKDLGSDGQRLVTAMVTMSKNVDMLKDHLYESEEAFREATAVSKEYEMQQQSAIGILERANNLWEKAFVNPDGVDAVKGMAEWWYEMSQYMTNSPILKGTLQVALQSVLWALRGIAALMPVIIGYIASQGLYSGFILLRQYGAALGVAVKSIYQYVSAIFSANTAQATLNKTMKLNPWVALASVVIGVAGAIYGYTQRTKEAAKAEMEAQRQANAWKDTLGQAAVETANLNKKLENYKRMMNESNLSQKERQGLISRFNKDFRSYISNLGIEIKNVKDLRDHYSDLAKEAQRATYYRMREQAKQQALPKLDADRNSAANALMAQVSALGLDKLGVSFNDIDRWVSKGANGNVLFWRLAKKMPKDKSGLVDGFTWKLDNKGFVYRSKYDGSKIGPSSSDKQMQFKLRDLLSASRWYANATGRRFKKEKEIEDNYSKWFPEGYTPYPEETPGTLENDAPEHGGGGKTGSGGNPNNTEKNVAKDRANALIANIKAFYEEQMRKYLEWVTQMNADGEKISEGQQKEQMDYLQSRMNLALGKARQSIATLDNGWKEFFQYMDEDVMVYDDETSKQLLESIGKADISELHDLFSKLSGDLSRENNKTLSENLGALLDQIFANGSKELREAAEKLLVRQREIQKILNEHDYTGAVNRNTRSEFDRLGFLQPAKDIRSDSPEGLNKMNAAFDKLTTKARESITVLYSLNPESNDFQSQFLDFLSVANEGFDFSKLKAQDLKALYLELIKYNDEYESASKKRDDERKKLNDYGWSKTDFYKDYQSKLPGMEQEASINGGYRNAGQRMGMESVSATDPELELLKARMAFAQQYYAFLEEHNATEQQLADARKGIMSEQANYAKKLTGDMFEQYNSLLTFMGPLQTFGESVGEAFATMTENASEGRKALKTALKQMIKSFATNTLQMISQQQIERAQTTAHYTQLLLMQQAFAQAQLQAEIANGTALIAAKQTVNLTEEQLEGIHQQVMAALRSAGIFGWCVSTLGPIAGPIAYSAMMATLMGLLNFAISQIGGGDKTNTNTNTKSNTKLVSGMLTYDSGNVQDLKPFVASDGSLYWATEDNKPHSGVSLLTQPTATTINGQPSLVAENGPELVIGRETTHAMMMNNPQLLKALVNYDRNYSGRSASRRAFDEGNVGATVGNLPSGASATDDLMATYTASNMALLQAVNTLLQRLEQPIEAKIDMFGRDKLYDSMNKANRFMKGK